MNSVEKDSLLQQAKCCAGTMGKEVAEMFLNGDPCANIKFKQLALLGYAIETLDCYEATLEEISYTLVDGELQEDFDTVEYDNCLTENEADTIAEIITDLCDICDCNNN